MCISHARVSVGDGPPQAESLTRSLVMATAFAHPPTPLNYLGEAGAIPLALGCFAMIFSLILS